jgi:hypothetical protein
MALCFIPKGGLGNLLFQHHAAWAHAKETDRTLHCPARHLTDRYWISAYPKLFKHLVFLNFIPHIDYEDHNGHLFSPIPADVSVIHGFFQSWKYFYKYREELRDLLHSNEDERWTKTKNKYSLLSGGEDVVCVHIRRGDNITNGDRFILLPESYYSRVLENFKNKKILIFSDDVDLIKAWDVWKGLHVYFVDEPDALDTFFLMSMCKVIIGANSTFSLMAYYMRVHDDTLPIFPKEWFVAGTELREKFDASSDFLHPDLVLFPNSPDESVPAQLLLKSPEV